MVYVSELVVARRPEVDAEGPDHAGRVRADLASSTCRASCSGRIEGGPNPARKDGLVAPHDVAVDSKGAIYVGEVTQTFGVKAGAVPEGTHSPAEVRAGRLAWPEPDWPEVQRHGAAEKPILAELKENAYLVLGLPGADVAGADTRLPAAWGRQVVGHRAADTSSGLRGIIFAPFIHANMFHLIANTVPFAVLGFLGDDVRAGTFLSRDACS